MKKNIEPFTTAQVIITQAKVIITGPKDAEMYSEREALADLIDIQELLNDQEETP